MKKPYPFRCIRWNALLLINSALILLSAVACNNGAQQRNYLNEVVPYRSSGKQVIMFIPLDGCGTCIEHSTAFINDHLLEKKYLNAYVYSLYNKKYLQFDSAVAKNDRLFIDTDNRILAALKVEQKPRVVFIEDGEILEDLFYDNGQEAEIFKKVLNF